MHYVLGLLGYGSLLGPPKDLCYIYVINACMLTLHHFNIMIVLHSLMCGTYRYQITTS
jgi:hypothetical protein